jgi:aconitate hydratase
MTDHTHQTAPTQFVDGGLTGRLPDWVSAKDVILEMLRRHKTDGGKGRIIEYYGPGLTCLSAMDRHVIANKGAELGATTSVFPSDDEIRRFLKRQKREQDWIELKADPDAIYDLQDHAGARPSAARGGAEHCCCRDEEGRS